jgi:hypothetical protein
LPRLGAGDSVRPRSGEVDQRPESVCSLLSPERPEERAGLPSASPRPVDHRPPDGSLPLTGAFASMRPAPNPKSRPELRDPPVSALRAGASLSLTGASVRELFPGSPKLRHPERPEPLSRPPDSLDRTGGSDRLALPGSPNPLPASPRLGTPLRVESPDRELTSPDRVGAGLSSTFRQLPLVPSEKAADPLAGAVSPRIGAPSPRAGVAPPLAVAASPRIGADDEPRTAPSAVLAYCSTPRRWSSKPTRSTRGNSRRE